MSRLRAFSAMVAAVLLVGSALASSKVHSQQAADVDGAKAASAAFYKALNTSAAAMLEVYAKTPYVAYVAPGMKAAVIGWESVKPSIEASWVGLPTRSIAITGSSIQVRGTLAWEVGNENGTVKTKDGIERKIDVFVTNIYERIDGKWLMVSHHAQPRPQ